MRAFCLGCLLAVFGCGHQLPTPALEVVYQKLGREDQRPTRWWAADRAGGRVVGFDKELFPRWVVSTPCPVGVARAGDGIWVVNVPGCGARQASNWTRIVAGSAVVPPRLAGEFAGLCGLPDGGVLGLVGPSPARMLMRMDDRGVVLRTETLPGATHLAQADGRVLVANRVGELWAFGLAEGLERAHHAQLGEVPRGLAPGPEAGWWWLGEQGTLLLLREDLTVRWRRWAGDRAALLVGDGKRAWVVPANRSWAGVWDADGRQLASLPMPSIGAQAARMTKSGGLLVAFPGALLEVDEQGAVLRTQAGVDHLVALSEPGA